MTGLGRFNGASAVGRQDCECFLYTAGRAWSSSVICRLEKKQGAKRTWTAKQKTKSLPRTVYSYWAPQKKARASGEWRREWAYVVLDNGLLKVMMDSVIMKSEVEDWRTLQPQKCNSETSWFSKNRFEKCSFGFWVLDFEFWIFSFGFWILSFWTCSFVFGVLGNAVLNFEFWIPSFGKCSFGFWVLDLAFWESVVLEGVVLDSVVLEGVVLESAVLESVVLESVVLESVVLERVVLEGVVFESVVLESVVLESVVLERVVLESVVLEGVVL